MRFESLLFHYFFQIFSHPLVTFWSSVKMAPTLTSLGRQPGAWSSSSSRQAGPSASQEGRITVITVTVITAPRWPLSLWTLHYLKQVTADREVKQNQHRFRQESWWFPLNTFPQPGCRHEFRVNHHLWLSYPQQNNIDLFILYSSFNVCESLLFGWGFTI